MIKKIEIDNSKKSADTSSTWSPNVTNLIKTCMESTTPNKLMDEVFLVHEKKEHPTGDSCKYPHHVFNGAKLVVSKSGVKAAYARAKQMHVYEGKIKEHLDKHRKELGMIAEEEKEKKMEESVESMFKMLEDVIASRNQRAITEETNSFVQMFEKPVVNPANGGSPIAEQPQQNVQPAQQLIQQPQPVPASNNDPAATTIPVMNVDPTEDTSTNNPIEGADDRDPDELDGNARKEMYQKFADTMVAANQSNVFGTIFDQDIFKSEYKIVPYEMRYFYRLQNPVSVEVGDLRLVPFGTELLDAQEKYGLGKKLFVFATYSEKPIFFNMLDKTIWWNETKLNDTFDGFIDQLTQSNGELDIGENGEQADANVEYTPDMTNPGATATSDANATQPGVTPVDLSGSAAGVQPVDLSNVPVNTPTQLTGGSVQPVDLTGGTNQSTVQPANLTSQNASYVIDDDTSILDLLEEGTAFPNDALDEMNKKKTQERERRKLGKILMG